MEELMAETRQAREALKTAKLSEAGSWGWREGRKLLRDGRTPEAGSVDLKRQRQTAETYRSLCRRTGHVNRVPVTRA